MSEKTPLIILTGPTAVGKTKIAIELAKAINGEIISADSAQVYKHMDIGSAKITKEEMDGIKHHLIDVLEPTQDFNVAIFKQMAKSCIDDIKNRGKIPIIAGGTGFYIQAVLYDIDFTENAESNEIRKELEALARENGAEYIHNLLCNIDEDSAKIIHANNQKRVIRAIEFYRLTGKKISKHNETEKQKTSAYDSFYFVLTQERETLYAAINKRVDNMIASGLVDEVKRLKEMGCKSGSTAMQALGYKEILAYLDDEYPLEEAINLIKRDTRHFAKRQLTWFKREKNVIWVEKQILKKEDSILTYLLSCMKN